MNFLICSHSLRGSPIVTLVVGEAAILFNVHRDLLCNASPFFRSAFVGVGSFKETSEQSMTLADDDVDAFERLVHWIYVRKYPLSDVKTSGGCQMGYMQLAMLYVIAEKYGVTELKNDIIDKVFEIRLKANPPPYKPVIKYLYSNTTAGLAFRALLAAWYVTDIDLNWYMEKDDPRRTLEDVPEFAIDLAIALGQALCGKGKPSPFQGSSSISHESTKGDQSKLHGKYRELGGKLGVGRLIPVVHTSTQCHHRGY